MVMLSEILFCGIHHLAVVVAYAVYCAPIWLQWKKHGDQGIRTISTFSKQREAASSFAITEEKEK